MYKTKTVQEIGWERSARRKKIYRRLAGIFYLCIIIFLFLFV